MRQCHLVKDWVDVLASQVPLRILKHIVAIPTLDTVQHQQRDWLSLDVRDWHAIQILALVPTVGAKDCSYVEQCNRWRSAPGTFIFFPNVHVPHHSPSNYGSTDGTLYSLHSFQFVSQIEWGLAESMTLIVQHAELILQSLVAIRSIS